MAEPMMPDEQLLIAEPWSEWTDKPLSDASHLHNKLSSRSRKSVDDLLESAKRRQQNAEAALAAKRAQQSERLHTERLHEEEVRAKHNASIAAIGEKTQRQQAAAEALRAAKLQQQAERLKRDEERAELVRQRKVSIGDTERGFGDEANSSRAHGETVIDLPWAMFGTGSTPSKDSRPPADSPLHHKLSSRTRKSVEQIMEETNKRNAKAAEQKARLDSERKQHTAREHERAQKVTERREGHLNDIDQTSHRKQESADAFRNAKLQQQAERLARERARAEEVRRRRMESNEVGPPEDATETPQGSPTPLGGRSLNSMQPSSGAASSSSSPASPVELMGALPAELSARRRRREVIAPVPFQAEFNENTHVMDIVAAAWTDKPSTVPTELAERLSARHTKSPEEILLKHKQRMQTAEEQRAAKHAAESQRLQKEREKEDQVRLRIETNAQAKSDAVACKVDEKMKSADGIQTRKAARLQLAAERKHQREKSAKARQLNATRTFGTTMLDDDDKLRLLKLVKENKLAALQDMAATGELGRLRNFQNHYGDSALILAAWYGHLDVAKLLLDVNGDVDIANCDGNTALNCAAYRGHASMVELLLIEGSEVDVQDNVTGKTALIKAAYGGHHKVVNLLLEAEADPDAVDSQGYGALAFAASFGHREVLASLLEHDADPDVADLFGITPLIHAAARGDFLSVRLLLEAGATATREDVEGKSALDYADSAGFDDVVAILADYASRDPNTAGMLQSTAGAMTERLAQIENGMEEQSMSPNKGSGTQRQFTNREYGSNAPASQREYSNGFVSQRGQLSQRNGGNTARLTPRMPPPQQSARPRVPLGGVGDVANALGTPRGFRGMKASSANVAATKTKITPSDVCKVDAGSMAYLCKKIFNLSVLLEQDTVTEDLSYPTFQIPMIEAY
jgi:ankyrin repeat protein|eukprot:jgi/Chrpa1/25945/Chrysochromulina_OHIO_Genome00010949-RA